MQMRFFDLRPAVPGTVLAFAAALSGAACGDADTADRTGDAATVAQVDAGAVPIPVIAIDANDYTFEIPARIPAGAVELRMSNTGAEPHHAGVIRLEGGHTGAEVSAAMQAWEQGTAPVPDWIVPIGGPGSAFPGGESSAIVQLDPGHYAIVCFIAGPDGVMHVHKGMVKDFEVSASGAPAAPPPESDLVIGLVDYAFQLPGAISPGEHVIRFENRGTTVHDAELLRLADGATPAQVLAWFEAPAGPPPFRPVAGTFGMVRGRSASAHVRLEPGRYLLLCMVPEGGTPHFAMGMKLPFTVAERAGEDPPADVAAG